MAKAIINGQEIFGNVHMGEGGSPFDSVLSEGVISTTSSYATASFNDISGYKYIIVKAYDTVDGTDYVDYKVFDVADIVGTVNFYMNLHKSVYCAITTTSISSLNYSGAYCLINVDIIATNDDIFDFS